MSRLINDEVVDNNKELEAVISELEKISKSEALQDSEGKESENQSFNIEGFATEMQPFSQVILLW